MRIVSLDLAEYTNLGNTATDNSVGLLNLINDTLNINISLSAPRALSKEQLIKLRDAIQGTEWESITASLDNAIQHYQPYSVNQILLEVY